MLHGETNTFANRKNYVKFIDYPEHKNKNKEAIVIDELQHNYTFINRKKEFIAEVKQWEKDQYDLNFHRTHHRNRTVSEKHLEHKLDNKKIMTSYTITENALFFQQKFNGNRSQINHYWEMVLDAFLFEADIPKDKVISAIVHHDQTSPHLHISISNFVDKYSVDQKRIIKSVNINQHNLYKNLIENKKYSKEDYQKWIKLRQIKQAYYNHQITEGDFQAYMDKNYDVNVLSKVQERINVLYKEWYGHELYNKKEDFIYLDKIRGFANSDIQRISQLRKQSSDYLKMERNIILQSRKTALNKEITNLKYNKKVDSDALFKLKQKMVLSNDPEEKQYLVNEIIDTEYNKLFGAMLKNLIKPDNKSIFDNFHALYQDFSINKNGNEKFKKETYFHLLVVAENLSEVRMLWNKTSEYYWLANTISKLIENNQLEEVDKIIKENQSFMKTYEDHLNQLYLDLPNKLSQCSKNLNDLKLIKNIQNDLDLLKTRMNNLFEDPNYQQLRRNWYFERDLHTKQEQFKLDVLIDRNKQKEDFKLDLSLYEKRLMFKKVLRERIDFDLKVLGLYEHFEKNQLNGIARNREYNKILQYCSYRQQEKEANYNTYVRIAQHLEIGRSDDLKQGNLADISWYDERLRKAYTEIKKGPQFTPLSLAREMYEGNFNPIDYGKKIKEIEKLPPHEQQQAKENIDFIKKIEISILDKEQLFKEIDLTKYQQIDQTKEKEQVKELLNDFQESLTWSSKEIVKEASKINNWFTEQDFVNDLNHYPNDLKFDNLPDIIKESSIFKQEFNLTNDINAIPRLNPAGIDMNFIKNICDNHFIERAKLVKNDQNVQRELKSESFKSINFKPADHFISLWTPPAINYATDLTNYELETQKERRLKILISMEHEEKNIDDLCKSWNISKDFIKGVVKKSRQLNMKDRELEIINNPKSFNF